MRGAAPPGAAAASRRASVLRRAAVATLGLACLLVGGVPAGLVAAGVLCPVTAVALARLPHRDRARGAALDRSLALALDLCAAALRAGRPLPDALLAAAPAAEQPTGTQLRRVAGLLRLGADPQRAWAAVAAEPDTVLAPLAAAAVRSASSGIRAAAAFERLAEQIRAESSAAATTRAYRAGVLALAPLGACFLPSFVCLGIVPVIVGIAHSALGVLR
ncbi:MAG TPA: type II secretion system F family protein [Jatrophihabitans sp.]|nr:type II secretion system F family protein [Jatrophihabitans sp.]